MNNTAAGILVRDHLGFWTNEGVEMTKWLNFSKALTSSELKENSTSEGALFNVDDTHSFYMTQIKITLNSHCICFPNAHKQSFYGALN